MLRRLFLPLLLLAALAGCRPGPAPEPPPPAGSPSVAPVGGPVPFHVHLAAGERLSPNPPAADSCTALSVRLVRRDGIVLITARGAACPPGDNSAVGNGRHGVYRTTADIPAGRTTTTATTPLGPATLFEQPYYECTNSCHRWSEPVAVITLPAPAAPDVRSLVVIAERGSLDLAGLRTLVTTRLTP